MALALLMHDVLEGIGTFSYSEDLLNLWHPSNICVTFVSDSIDYHIDIGSTLLFVGPQFETRNFRLRFGICLALLLDWWIHHQTGSIFPDLFGFLDYFFFTLTEKRLLIIYGFSFVTIVLRYSGFKWVQRHPYYLIILNFPLPWTLLRSHNG
jgi:hypothetical protein